MSSDSKGPPTHEYRLLISRWEALARTRGLTGQAYATAGPFELFCWRSPAFRPEGGLYLSAGIHGDEAGAVEGLYTWAALEGNRLRTLPVILFPCLNPHGLERNCRTDAAGHDLNRCYHRQDVPPIRAHQALLAGHRFRLALCLHEDCDARGVYLYEFRRRGAAPIGAELLRAAGPDVPTDALRRLGARGVELIANLALGLNFTPLPAVTEALYLARHHSERTITTETPAGYGLGQRARAQVTLIRRALELTPA
ncbi:MAG: succinylglutamate desuccinylase/aspartoacylase family protein [Verrucomicrobia bacterium]|nr:succinylglutamate desuccinylase/aspartoacylase family protein [Verrucomicrobiota bacterium]